MKEKRYGYGAWEYRYICKNCGHAVRAPKNEEPCSVCGGDFGPKISVRKLYLEAEKPFETVEVEYPLPKTFFERIKEALGFKVEQRFGVREEKRRPSRRWRWQTHAEVEEESGVVRHEWPISLAHFHGWLLPHSHMLRKMGRPAERSASLISW